MFKRYAKKAVGFNKSGGSNSRFLLIGLVVVFVVFFYSKIKGALAALGNGTGNFLENIATGITNTIGTLTGGLVDNVGKAVEKSKDVIGDIGVTTDYEKQRQNREQNFAKPKVTPNSYQRELAEYAYQCIDHAPAFFGATMFYSDMNDTEEKKLYNKLINQSNLDLAGCYVAYNTRYANHRLSKLLGMIWDNTEGTLLEHINRYMDNAKYRDPLAKKLHNAINTHL